MVVARVFLDRFEVNAFEQHFEISPAERVFYGILPVVAKGTLLQSFAPDAVTAAVKIEYLCLVAFAVDEYKELTAERIFLKLVFHQS